MYISLFFLVTGILLITVVVIILLVILKHSKQAMSDDESEQLCYHDQKHTLEGCVDGAKIITLDKNVDTRAKTCLRHVQSASIKADLFVVKRHPKGGIYGCMDSHQKLAQYALNKGYSTFLFLEDDARIGAVIPEGLSDEIRHVLDSPKPVAIYLGYMTGFTGFMAPTAVTKHIYSMPSKADVLMAHAIAMNRPCMQIIVSLNNTGQPEDAYDQLILRDTRIHRFVVYPMIFHQCSCGTDIGESDAYFATYAERYMGVPRTMRLLSIVSFNNALLPILIFGVVIMVFSIPSFYVEKRIKQSK
jgi:GR25 family glycosyltransferase involved in LPS biosynthesis